MKIKPVLSDAEIAVVKAKQKIGEEFETEVGQANKEKHEVEATEEQFEALKEILSKMDWTHTDLKSALKENKISTATILNSDAFLEELVAVLKAAPAA